MGNSFSSYREDEQRRVKELHEGSPAEQRMNKRRMTWTRRYLDLSVPSPVDSVVLMQRYVWPYYNIEESKQ